MSNKLRDHLKTISDKGIDVITYLMSTTATQLLIQKIHDNKEKE